MGTKADPGKYDCHAAAAPNEPIFTLLGRDKHAPVLLEMWAWMREFDGEDPVKVAEARRCAQAMRAYRVHLQEQRLRPDAPRQAPQLTTSWPQRMGLRRLLGGRAS